jgi:predicted metallopeptidase
MKTFFNILQTITKAAIIKYPGETNKFVPLVLTGTSDMYTDYSVYSFICKIYNEFEKTKNISFTKKIASSKFKALNYFFNNKFNTQKQIECVFDAFSKAQRVYFALNKFVNIYKLKKYPKVVTDDLSMTPLDIKNNNTFALVQNKSVYLFSLNELIQIVETALGHAPSFFSDPYRAKNPFNNEELSNATLYNIYFKMKDSTRVISTIFHFYFLSHFNNEEFVITNEAFLREYAIKKYVFTTPALCLHPSVIEMLSANPFTKKLTIHKDFPKEELVEIFRPFLYYSYIVNYDIRGMHKLSQYKRILHHKLKKFYEYNKAFGRRIIELKPQPINFINYANVNYNLLHLLDTPAQVATPKKKHRRETKVTFNTKHIGFHNIDISDIQTDIQEAAQLLFYFSTNVEYDEDEEYYSSEEETVASLDEEEPDPLQNVTPNNSEADPEVSTLESDEYDDEDTVASLDDELNDENISTLRREYGDYDDQQHYSDNDEYDNNDDNDSIS